MSDTISRVRTQVGEGCGRWECSREQALIILTGTATWRQRIPDIRPNVYVTGWLERVAVPEKQKDSRLQQSREIVSAVDQLFPPSVRLAQPMTPASRAVSLQAPSPDSQRLQATPGVKPWSEAEASFEL